MTIREMEDRKQVHESRAKNGSSSYFHHALRKYGFDAFKWKVIGRSDDPEELRSMEIAEIWMLETKAPDGYNLTDGGDGWKGGHHSPESNARNRESHLGKCPPKLLVILHLIHEKNRGKKRPRDVVDKIAQLNRGKKRTAEQRTRIGNSRKYEKQSLELIEKRISPLRGKKRPPEVGRKISEAKRRKK